MTHAPRPNILWLMSEDCSPHGEAYGDPLARTPTINRLAREGVLFEQAFCTSPVCAPSRFSLISGVHAASCGPAHQMRALAHFPDGLDTYAGLMREAGYHCTNNAKTDYNSDLDKNAIWDDSGPSAHWRHRPEGAPFLAVFNPNDTHESALFAEEISYVSPDEVRVPAYLPDTPEIRADIARYYTAIEKVDTVFAHLLAEVEQAGLLEDTILLYSSDHGGVGPRSKRFCYDDGLRVPLIVRLPQRYAHLSPWHAGERVGTAVSHIDIAPTLLALGGVPIPGTMQGRPLFGPQAAAPGGVAFGGRNRMGERYDFVRTVRDSRYRYIRNYSPHRPHGQHVAYMWLAQGYQAWETAHRAGTLSEASERFWQEKPAEEFYDTVTDPDEVHNLIGAPEHAERIEHLSSLLDRHMLDINDNGFIPEGSPIEGYDNSRVPGAYPLHEVMELAGRAIQRAPGSLGLFIDALGHDNEVLRYWGAQGLLMLGPDSAPAGHALDTALRDASPQVRIAAAEAHAKTRNPEEAVGVLAGILAGDHARPVKLQALNALTFLGAAAADATEEIAEFTEAADPNLRSASRYLLLRLRDEYTPGTTIFDLTHMTAHPPASVF
ncbi:sulfatase-like hydrolase/transferase [Streptomyces blattellae]|uniref:sulfatase-like hydrolase/transferase n=1 Tax=Streptomyces blattellae TaxID=2569855 RepID=UPI0012B85AEA|nr:sulfatase-like hydrolase/transferase [Streptomyces blattellae]